eukprot:CAMPEP_0202891364 /NCGR_PEP_ID=MMETSP1392-20130828/1443_1 /ASSEMBLY_ACC=CAM_ASM_000868 /TAXON_ID=225041 /ORGANISM="Chlamydomonas chlamydogama, Strain SAG 11-48b" /LENGTH=75 /DNA_ID=CAMNT_0049575093 /DNA_START=103 /DNA_END=327 /DNA_ORIENTATION=-
MTDIDIDLEAMRSKIAQVEVELAQLKQTEANEARLAHLEGRLFQLETQKTMLMAKKYGATPPAAGSGGLPEAVAT